MKLNHKARNRHARRIANRNCNSRSTCFELAAQVAADPISKLLAEPAPIPVAVVPRGWESTDCPADLLAEKVGELRVRKSANEKTFELLFLSNGIGSIVSTGHKLQKDAVAFGLETYGLTAKKLLSKKESEADAA